MFHNTLQTKATEMAPQARGTAIAVFAFSLFMGQAGGVAACGLLISVVGYQWSFVLAGVGLLGLGQSFAKKVQGDKVKP
jgi:MFS family permease